MIINKNKQYVLHQELGRGSYATTYRATLGSSQFAAKVINLELVSLEQSEVQKESSIIRELKHKNVVQLVDSYRQGSKFVLVMEYCRRGTLDKFCQKEFKNRINFDFIHYTALQLFSALSFLFRNHIVHRDIKLANILVSQDFTIKIADFGMARYFTEDVMNTHCGSPVTMAPQIYKGGYSHKCDVWSVGVILYRLLYGRYPFSKNKYLTYQDIRNFDSDKLEIPEAPLVPDWFRNLLRATIQTSPLRRIDIPQIMQMIPPFADQTALLAQLRLEIQAGQQQAQCMMDVLLSQLQSLDSEQVCEVIFFQVMREMIMPQMRELVENVADEFEQTIFKTTLKFEELLPSLYELKNKYLYSLFFKEFMDLEIFGKAQIIQPGDIPELKQLMLSKLQKVQSPKGLKALVQGICKAARSLQVKDEEARQILLQVIGCINYKKYVRRIKIRVNFFNFNSSVNHLIRQRTRLPFLPFFQTHTTKPFQPHPILDFITLEGGSRSSNNEQNPELQKLLEQTASCLNFLKKKY